MTVVQFHPRARRPSVVPLKPGMTLAGTEGHSGPITQSRFEEAHRLADEAERLPPVSEAVAMFIAAAKGRLTDVSGDIEDQLRGMSARQLRDMVDAMRMICEAPEVDLEDDFIGDMVAFEVRRRELGVGPDGAA